MASSDEPAGIERITAIDVVERDGGTEIAILGTTSPTFSVYRLEDPARLFLDFSNTEMSGDVTSWNVQNGLIEDVLVLQFQDDLSIVTRVVVTLEDEYADYDIEPTDEGLVLIVTGEGNANVSAAELERQRRALQASATEIATLREEARQAEDEALRSEADRRTALLRTQELELDRQQLDAENRRLRETTAAAESRAERVGADYADALTTIQVYQGEIRDQQISITEMNDQSLEWRQAVGALRAELGRLNLDLGERDDQMREVAAREDELNEQIEELRETGENDSRAVSQIALERDQQVDELRRLQQEYDAVVEETSSTHAQLSTVEANLTESIEQQFSAESRLAEYRSRMLELEALVGGLREEAANGEESLRTSNEQLARLEAQVAEMVVSERAQIALAEDLAARAEAAATEAEAEQMAAQREQVIADLAAATEARRSAEESTDQARGDLERTSALLAQGNEDMERLQHELDQAAEDRETLYASLEVLAADQLVRQQALLAAQEEQAQIEHDAARLAEERADTERELENARAERERTEAELFELQARRAESAQAVQRSEEERATIARELAQLTTERDELNRELERVGSLLDSRREATATVDRLEPEARAQEVTVPTVIALSESAREAADAPTEESATPVILDEIIDVRFEQDGNVDRILVEFAGTGGELVPLSREGSRAGVLIEGVILPEELQRTLDTRAFGGPVQFVSTFTDNSGQVHLVAEIEDAGSEILSRDGRILSWEFSSSADYESDLWASDFEGYNAQEQADGGAPTIRRRGVSYTIGESGDRLRVPRLSRRFRVTIDVVSADIQNVLRLFSDQGDVNIIASGGVSGTITLRLRAVPLDLAFALILQSQGLGFEQRGNIIRVAPQTEFDEERRRELERIAEAFEVQPLQVRVRAISYASGSSLQGVLDDVLSDRGHISFDERTHTLIMTDVSENLDAAEQLIDLLDTQTPQVLIEARIVQTGETFSQGFGIQWGGDALFSPANGNATGLLFPSTVGIAGGAGNSPADGTSSTPNFAVNIPGPGVGSVGFQLGSLGQAVNLNLRLSAAESSGSAKVVSAPRILTLDGQSATISTGLQIPVQSVGAAGANVTFIQADLSLTVTPTVTPDGYVHLEINLTKNEPDFARTGANGDPTIVTRTATTQLLVRDGETSVIGGIFEHISGSDQTSVPFFSDIPILGALFHDYSFQDERTETLLFITPRIINRDVSLSNYTPGGVLMTPPGE
jgi:type IV pilus assembly protein PilQ